VPATEREKNGTVQSFQVSCMMGHITCYRLDTSSTHERTGHTQRVAKTVNNGTEGFSSVPVPILYICDSPGGEGDLACLRAQSTSASLPPVASATFGGRPPLPLEASCLAQEYHIQTHAICARRAIVGLQFEGSSEAGIVERERGRGKRLALTTLITTHAHIYL
jgi:hypothetical protein